MGAVIWTCVSEIIEYYCQDAKQRRLLGAFRQKETHARLGVVLGWKSGIVAGELAQHSAGRKQVLP